MSSWNRPPDPHASAFSPSVNSGSPSGAGVAPWTAPERVPSWLRPFTLDANTRFTRTPDVFLRSRPKVEPAPVPVPAAPEPEPEPVLSLDPTEAVPDVPASQVQACAEDMGDDEILIDWTGATWAARMAPETLEPALLEPAEPQAAAAIPEPVLEAAAIEEPVVLRRRLPEDAPSEDDACEALDEDMVEACAAPDGDFVPEVEVEVEVEAPAEIGTDSRDQDTVACAPETSAEAAPVIETEPDDVPAHLRRLAHLIVIAPAILPQAAEDQDLVASEPEPEPEVVEVTAEALAPQDEEIIPITASEEPTPVPKDLCVAPQDAPVAPLSGLIGGPALTVTFSWPIFATAALAPLPVAGPVPGVQAVPEADLSGADETVALDIEGAESPAAMADEFDCAMEIIDAPIAGSEPEAVPAPEAVPEAATRAPVLSYGYQLPDLDLLAEPPLIEPAFELSEEALDRNSTALQQTLRDFGVRGEVIDANPGPVVTLYEFEPAPGTKSSRVIGLSADIARSMSAVSARVAVVEGRNVIGIELPNQRRETVWLRELMASHAFSDARAKLGLCLGKTIGGEPVIVDLARMPHLLVAGTTGSGKSVAINTMILSLLYRMTPEQCRLIMIDPKMLELSVYEGIPHLLTPVVTDPKKAIIALQWAVREMEDRYRKMSRLKVRNIEGFNARVAEAREKGEVITCTVQTGFDKETGEVNYEDLTMDLTSLPYIVIIVDEMADLMMVAGKDIEGAIQRLAQMARAAGIHLVMATQRPSVDVITGTIKANFPTRISFQVTSKIDSRTILGEMGAETLLGQGDMLYMANGGRITRVHGPFVSDTEVEHVVAHLKAQGRPEYLEAVTSDDGTEEDVAEDTAVFDKSPLAEESGDHYEQAVAVVLRDRKASTSYIQRRLQIGYNKAASLMERMENEGIVGPANHAGKREILSNRQA